MIEVSAVLPHGCVEHIVLTAQLLHKYESYLYLVIFVVAASTTYAWC
jgi:hypothetical protein